MLLQVSNEISIKRRGFAKAHVAMDYKELCECTRPIIVRGQSGGTLRNRTAENFFYGITSERLSDSKST